MTIGTKSVLFGVHNPIIHTYFHIKAWKILYNRWPHWKTIVCMFVHDLGYIGKSNMDGKEGKSHPELGAYIASKLFDRRNPFCSRCMARQKDTWSMIKKSDTCSICDKYARFVLGHSRSYAKSHNMYPSELCWSDKLAVVLEPYWLYIPRAILTGEIKEYYQEGIEGGLIKPGTSYKNWKQTVDKYFVGKLLEVTFQSTEFTVSKSDLNKLIKK